VTAGVNLAPREESDDDRIPYPLEWGTYSSAAISPDTNAEGDIISPRPSREEQVRRLQQRLVEEMQDPDGDIDVDDLLDLGV
jgi:hypothetical protein